MTYEHINQSYVNWLFNLVCKDRFPKQVSYNRLLNHLDGTRFIFTLPNDENRAKDGVYLRYQFAMEFDIDPDIAKEVLGGPCSVLEMMVALAIKCENFMDDPAVGDRTRQWFWGMIKSLGLDSMTDDQYDERYVRAVLIRFMDREYEPDGRGGLFTIYDCDQDLRYVEIWWQLCWYLDKFT